MHAAPQFCNAPAPGHATGVCTDYIQLPKALESTLEVPANAGKINLDASGTVCTNAVCTYTWSLVSCSNGQGPKDLGTGVKVAAIVGSGPVFDVNVAGATAPVVCTFSVTIIATPSECSCMHGCPGVMVWGACRLLQPMPRTRKRI
jgi:hypothetical protein